jgi:pimeloyl-ACP methyl ester carboxylesterase
VRGEFIDVSGTRLYCYAAGTRGGGDPIVFLHGFPGSSHTWSGLTPLLPEGRRALVLDLAGCGRSDPPNDGDFGTSAHATRVGQLLKQLRVERAVVVGHGYGAAIGITLALQVHELVSALFLIAPSAPSDWPSPTGATYEWSGLGVPGVPDDWRAKLVAKSIRRSYLDEPRGQHSAEQFLRPYLTGGFTTFRAQSAALARDRDSGPPDLTRVQAHSTVIRGERDTITTSADAASLVDRLPHASLELVKDSGYCLPEESPEHLAALFTRLLQP